MQSNSSLSTAFRQLSVKSLWEETNSVDGPWNHVSEDFTVLADSDTGNKDEVHPHHFLKVVYTRPTGLYQTYDTWGGGYLYSSTGVQPGHSAETNLTGNNGRTAAYNRCLSKLYGKVRHSNLNVDIDGAEGRETARMLRNTIRAIRDVKKFAKKAVRDVRKDPTLTLSNAWLQYRYGWLPAVSTIYGALEHQSLHWNEFIVRSSASAGFSASRVIDNGQYQLPRKTSIESHQYRTKMQISYRVTNAEEWALDRIATLDPASLAWEVLPGSFVVDWIYNVGGYLRAKEIALNSNLAFVEGWRTDTSLETNTTILDGKFYQRPWDPGDSKWTKASMAGHYVRKEKNRYLLSQMPFPQQPTLEFDLGGKQLISAAALLRQLFS